MFVLVLGAAAQLDQSSASSLVRHGHAAVDADDFATAARDFEQAVQLNPENLDAHRGLVFSYLRLGRLTEAEKAGQSAVSKWPDDAPLQHWLGLVYFKQRQNAKALQALGRAESLDKTSYDIHFDIALVLLSEDKYNQAADELETAIKIKPQEALPHLLLGRAYQNTNRTVEAIEQFRMALRIEPDLKLGHYHLGFVYASLGRNQEAIAEYEKELVREAANPIVLYQLGHLQLEAGDWKAAVEHLKKAAETDPKISDAFYDLGKALLLQGDAEGAILVLRQAIALKPGDPGPHYQLARALEKAGRKEEARGEFETFAALKKAQPVTGGMAAGPVP